MIPIAFRSKKGSQKVKKLSNKDVQAVPLVQIKLKRGF
jgi:hypothetical protein